MIAILIFLVAHWALAIFVQSFFLHRYSAHRMFTMSKGWERFFHVLTWIGQGSSFLSPRAYAIMHREHHAYSDTELDPHSPHVYTSFPKMMWQTKERYHGLLARRIEPETRFEGGYPSWPWLERLADSWWSRIGWGTAYTLFYLAFAPHPAFLLLLPVHYLMGPIHGAIVNWGGHKYGYRNFEIDDRSRNTLPIELLTGGELFQNNHHKWGMAPDFAARWFEVDPTYQVMRLLHGVRIIDMTGAQKPRWTPADKKPLPPKVTPNATAPAVLSPADAE